MSLALIVIASGAPYWSYARRLINSAKEHLFSHDVVLFTDSRDDFGVAHQFKMESLVWPQATLMRYHHVAEKSDLLSKYGHVFYTDADMLFAARVEPSEILADGLTATEHPGFLGDPGTPENRPESTAYVARPRTYFCGGFNGGTSEAYLRMADTIRQNIDKDASKGITARWFDESHLNRYLFDHPPAKVLPASFCFPSSRWRQEWYAEEWRIVRGDGYRLTPKLLAVDKPWKPGPTWYDGLRQHLATKRRQHGLQSRRFDFSPEAAKELFQCT